MRIHYNNTPSLQKAGSLPKEHRGVYFATPTYDGRVSTHYTQSLLMTSLNLFSNGLNVMQRFSKHDGFVHRSRNRLIDDFLKSGCTHIAMIDADQGWEWQKFIKMIDRDKDFIVGAVRQKKFDEEYALRVNTVNTPLGFKCLEKDGLISVYRIGLAFAIVKREVFEKLSAFHDLKDTIDDGKMYTDFRLNDVSQEVGKLEPIYDYMGEDFNFCEKCTDAGVEIWMYPDIDIQHVGEVDFESNFHDYLCRQPGGSKHVNKQEISDREKPVLNRLLKGNIPSKEFDIIHENIKANLMKVG